MTTVRDFLKEKASVLHEDVSVLEEYARKLENDFFIKLDLKLFTILPEKWQEYGIPQNIVDEILKVKKKDSIMSISLFKIKSPIFRVLLRKERL